MRLLLVTHARGRIGGVESFLRGIAPGLIARGHELALVCAHRWEQAGEAGDPYAGAAAEWCLETTPAGTVLAAARAWAPEVVWLQPLEDPALEAAFAALAPAVWHVHGYAATCATGTRLQWRPAAHACGRALGAGCLAQNYLHGCGARNPVVLARQWRRETRRRQGLGRYAAIVACSKYVARELVRQGADEARVRAMPYPLLRPRPAAPAPRTQAPDQVLCLSRLTRLKGVELLLRALPPVQAALRRPLQLTIAGHGPEEARLRKLAKELGIAARWLGWIGAEAIDGLLRETDVLAVPSVWPEPFGIVGQEAQAAGVPAVAFAHGGIPEWLEDGVNGALAPAQPPTAVGLAGALTRVLASREDCDPLRQGAWASAARWDRDRFLQELEAVFAAAKAGARTATAGV